MFVTNITRATSFCNAVFALFFVLLFFASCSRDEVSPYEIASAPRINGATIASPALSDGVYVKSGRDSVLYITLPIGTDLSQVTLNLDVEQGGIVSHNGVELTGNSGVFNLNDMVELEVTSGIGGAKAVYTVLAQEGVSELDRLIYDFKDRYAIPGVSFAISTTDESRIVYKSGIGFSIRDDRVRAQPDHLFRLASISKQFTALCIMRLWDEGLLTLNDIVFGSGGILEREFPLVSERAATVTVRHLLEHTSGWTSDPDQMFAASFRGQTLEQRIGHLLNESEQEVPGETYRYLNMGYGILGKVVEELSGEDFETYLKEVLSEAGISDIHVGGNRQQRRPNEAVYYSQGGLNGYNNEMEVIKAAGGLIASTEEMLKLQYYIDGRDNIPDILSAEARALMLTPSEASERYTLGWRTGHDFFPDSWYHGGNLAGTAVLWVMGVEMNAVILCNSRSPDSDFDDDLFYLMRNIIQTASELDWN